jgi:hypothetical protein
MSRQDRLSALRSAAIAASVIWALTILLPDIGLFAPIGMLTHLSVFFNRGDPWAHSAVARRSLRWLAWLQMAFAGVIGVISISMLMGFLQRSDGGGAGWAASLGIATIALGLTEIHFTVAVERVLQGGGQSTALDVHRV